MGFTREFGKAKLRTFKDGSKSIVCTNVTTGIETLVSPPNPANGRELGIEMSAQAIKENVEHLRVIECVALSGNTNYVLYLGTEDEDIDL